MTWKELALLAVLLLNAAALAATAYEAGRAAGINECMGEFYGEGSDE